MVNLTKTRLMTKCSIYEKNGGNEDIEISGYYKSDYIRFMAAKAIVFSTIGYVGILGLYILYNLNYFFEIAFVIDYRTLGYKLLAFYFIIIVITLCFNYAYSSLKYDKSKFRLNKYSKTLSEINEMNEQNEIIKDLEA